MASSSKVKIDISRSADQPADSESVPRMVNRAGVLMIDGFSHELDFDVNNDSIESVAYESHFGLSESVKEIFGFDSDLDLTGIRVYKGVSYTFVI